jgi:phage tail sheath gpL-like
MTIPFSQIPSNIRVPLFYAEVDNSKANTAPRPQRTLLIGQKLAAGDATANVPILCQSLADAKGRCGAGSILAVMADAYIQNDPLGELWLLPLVDDGAATAATGSMTFTTGFGSTLAAGVLSLYLGGSLLAVPIAYGQSATQIATTVAAAINATGGLLVSAAVDGTITSKVNFTAKNKGLAGNDIDIRVNYRGARAGEVLQAGLTTAQVAMAGGTVNPSLTTGLTNLAELGFDFIVSAYTDATSTSAITAFLSDASGRWNPLQKLYGHCLIAYRGTMGTAATFLATLNDQHLTCIPFFDSPTPNFALAAAFFGAAAISLRNDPGQPLQTLTVAGVLAPPVASRYTLTQRNSLLYEGGATFKISSGGVVSIENMTTTYQTNAQGAPDDSYLEIETLFLLMYVLRALQSVVTTKYARRKLAADGTRLFPGSNVVTPSIIKADLIAQYRELEAAGFVQNSTAFAQSISVEKNGANPNRVDVLYPATLINQLRIFALLAQFRLS